MWRPLRPRLLWVGYYNMMKTWVSSNYIIGEVSALRNSWEGGEWKVCCLQLLRRSLKIQDGWRCLRSCFMFFVCYCAVRTPVGLHACMRATGAVVLVGLCLFEFFVFSFCATNESANANVTICGIPLLIACVWGCPPYDTLIPFMPAKPRNPSLVLLMGWQDVGPRWGYLKWIFLCVRHGFIGIYLKLVTLGSLNFAEHKFLGKSIMVIVKGFPTKCFLKGIQVIVMALGA